MGFSGAERKYIFICNSKKRNTFCATASACFCMLLSWGGERTPPGTGTFYKVAAGLVRSHRMCHGSEVRSGAVLMLIKANGMEHDSEKLLQRKVGPHSKVVAAH